MERLLLFCGVWIIIVPILFQNSYFEEHKKYILSMQIIGFFAFLMGILHFFNIVKKGHYLEVVLFCVLFVWVGKLSYDKIKNENAKIIRTACCISNSYSYVFIDSSFCISKKKHCRIESISRNCVLSGLYKKRKCCFWDSSSYEHQFDA